MGMFKLLCFIMRSPENYNMLQIALMVILTPGHLFLLVIFILIGIDSPKR